MEVIVTPALDFLHDLIRVKFYHDFVVGYFSTGTGYLTTVASY